MEGYIARDESGILYFHKSKPARAAFGDIGAWASCSFVMLEIAEDTEEFRNITWESEPVKVKITIKRL